MSKLRVGSMFSGVGAFEQALERLGIEYDNILAADWDKYARQTYLHNYDAPKYYVEDVYDTPVDEIEQLDLLMLSPPCQAFSLAGKRKGEDDDRGVLFYNSHEFILKNNPRYFIFENVKGLLSDSGGKTFQRWLDFLGGKSVNGNPVIFPMDEAAPYHIYWQVLNAKDYGIPQNRERVFIIGIRDDQDNQFSFPKPFPLEKRLKDVLEAEVDEKYFLSDKMLNYFDTRASNFNNGNINFKDEESVASTITSSSKSLDISDNIIRLANVNPSGNGMNGNVFDSEGISPTLSTNKGEGIKIKSATKCGYEVATENDSINFSVPNSETRRGRVGKGVAQTLDTACNQGVMVIKHQRTEEAKVKRKQSLAKGKDSGNFADREMIAVNQEVSDTILANPNPQKEGLILDVKIGAIRGRNPENPSDRTTGAPTEQRLEINNQGVSNTLTSVQKDNVVILDLTNDFGEKEKREYGEYAPSLRSSRAGLATFSNYKIRRLTPRECFRLQDFPDTFTWPVSDSQAYKQAGNSIAVGVLAAIIEKLKL